ncbi:MAG: hypothetical protein IAE98_03195 [Candidatus Kapabacteria bacterium]|nr:hypothetical protein [Candidatus Kapabacteria bacterium]
MNMNLTSGNIPGRLVKNPEKQQSLTTNLGYSIIGRIKIGERYISKNGKELPRSIDYFRATGAYSEVFHQKLGDKPNILEIVFPSADHRQVCFQRIEGRDSKGNLCAVFNGAEYFVYDTETQKYLLCSQQEFEKAKQNGIKVKSGFGANEKIEIVKIDNWKERLTIRFFVLKLPGILGVWELSTSGTETGIPNIIQNYDDLVKSVGQNINKVVCELNVKFASSNKPGTQSKYPVLQMTPNISYESSLLLKQYSQQATEYNMLLNDQAIHQLSSGEEQRVSGHLQLAEANIETVDDDNYDDFKTVEIVEVVEEVQEPQTKAEPKKKLTFTPESFKEWALKDSAMYMEKVPTSEMLDNVATVLNLYSKNVIQDRISVLQYLFGKHSLDKLTFGECSTLIKWLKTEKVDGIIIPSDMATITQFEQIIHA